MFIVWGKKVVRRKLGHVADFCPICRVPQGFALTRVGVANHVYYVTSGDGELAGFERTCHECGTSMQAEPTQYASVAKKPLPLAELRRETFPQLEAAWRDRLELEARIRQAPRSLSAEERHALIRSPFLLLSPKVEKRFNENQIDKQTGLAMLGAVLLIAFGPALVEAVAPSVVDTAWLVFLAAGLGLIVWVGLGSGRRYMRREVIPQLAKALRPLRPTADEINAVLAEMKQLRHKMGSKLKVDDLIAYARAEASRAS